MLLYLSPQRIVLCDGELSVVEIKDYLFVTCTGVICFVPDRRWAGVWLLECIIKQSSQRRGWLSEVLAVGPLVLM